MNFLWNFDVFPFALFVRERILSLLLPASPFARSILRSFSKCVRHLLPRVNCGFKRLMNLVESSFCEALRINTHLQVQWTKKRNPNLLGVAAKLSKIYVANFPKIVIDFAVVEICFFGTQLRGKLTYLINLLLLFYYIIRIYIYFFLLFDTDFRNVISNKEMIEHHSLN